MTTYSASAVAAEIRRRLPGVPVKKLHKLLYYAQAHHVTSFGEPLFSEMISAWDMGPVVAQLWWLEKNAPAPASADVHMDEAELNTIGYVVSRYGKLSGLELERLTHTEAPWIEANAERQKLNTKSHRISVNSIIGFFSEQALAEELEPPVDSAQVAACVEDAAVREREPMPADDTPEGLLARLR